jgi:hypothetical protein
MPFTNLPIMVYYFAAILKATSNLAPPVGAPRKWLNSSIITSASDTDWNNVFRYTQRVTLCVVFLNIGKKNKIFYKNSTSQLSTIVEQKNSYAKSMKTIDLSD